MPQINTSITEMAASHAQTHIAQYVCFFFLIRFVSFASSYSQLCYSEHPAVPVSRRLHVSGDDRGIYHMHPDTGVRKELTKSSNDANNFQHGSSSFIFKVAFPITSNFFSQQRCNGIQCYPAVLMSLCFTHMDQQQELS